MTEAIGSVVEIGKVKIENKIVKGEEVPLETSYNHLGKYILDSISVNPDAIAQIDAATDEIDTFADIKDRSVRCAIWLRKQGVRQNDVIGIRSHNQLNTCIPVYAALYLGTPYFPIDDTLDIRSTKYFLSLGKPRIFFVDEESANVMFQAIKESESDVKIVVFGKYPGAESFSDILAEASEQEVTSFKCDEIPNMQHIALIAPTSGTTGMPKGVTLPHEYFFHWLQYCDQWKCTEGPIIAVSKLAWITSHLFIICSPVRKSSRIIFTTTAPEAFLDIINKYKPAVIFITTYLAYQLTKSENANKCDFSSLKEILLAGAPITNESITALRELAKNSIVNLGYAMTEIGIVTLKKSDVKPKSVGLPLENIQLKIVDIHSGQILGPNEKGEICVKSPARMVEYYNNPETTIALFDEEGFLRTGDFGYYDEDGYLFILDRLKEVIIFRGRHVLPVNIEIILQSHPAVQEVAVVGKRHNIEGEHPVAFVTKVPGKKVTEQQLVDLVAKELTDIERLRGGVIFLEAMPHTNASGKINRSKLKEMVNPVV